jgi:hypothetical protein
MKGLLVLLPLSILMIINKLDAQILRMDLMTDVIQLSKGNAANALVQIQSPFAPKLGFVGGYSFHLISLKVGNYQYQSEGKSISGEVRIYPFEKKLLKKDNTRCFSFGKNKQPLTNDFLKIIYFAPGYEEEQLNINLTPNKDVQSPLGNYKLNIANKALTFNLGALIRFSQISFGISYRYSAGKPIITGNYDKFTNDIINSLYPSSYRIQKALRVEAGFNF